MISPDYARTMARYNAWQNRWQYREADRLTEAQRREDRGAFFRSLHGTLAHILWGDMMWMSRFDGWEKPPIGLGAAPEDWLDWDALKAARPDADARIAAWAAGLTPAALEGALTWRSGVTGAELTKPRWQLVAQLFNHQTHHRGQAHAILTGFGVKTDPTDLGFMPDDA
jgi:uncharacterized damage-inducible protein DinB